MDISATPVLAVMGGTGAIVVAWQFLWPLLRQLVETQTARGRAERDIIDAATLERDKALERARAADTRADEAISAMSSLQSQVALLTYQLEVSNEKVERLAQQLTQAQSQLAELTAKIGAMGRHHD